MAKYYVMSRALVDRLAVKLTEVNARTLLTL